MNMLMEIVLELPQFLIGNHKCIADITRYRVSPCQITNFVYRITHLFVLFSELH